MWKIANTKWPEIANTERQVDNYNLCPICGCENIIVIKDMIANTVCEVETECTKCGHLDFWSYGSYGP